jgi:hypothetical protein
MTNKVTVHFLKCNSVRDSQLFHDVDEIRVVGMTGGGKQILIIREDGENSSVDDVITHTEEWH